MAGNDPPRAGKADDAARRAPIDDAEEITDVMVKPDFAAAPPSAPPHDPAVRVAPRGPPVSSPPLGPGRTVTPLGIPAVAAPFTEQPRRTGDEVGPLTRPPDPTQRNTGPGEPSTLLLPKYDPGTPSPLVEPDTDVDLLSRLPKQTRVLGALVPLVEANTVVSSQSALLQPTTVLSALPSRPEPGPTSAERSAPAKSSGRAVLWALAVTGGCALSFGALWLLADRQPAKAQAATALVMPAPVEAPTPAADLELAPAARTIVRDEPEPSTLRIATRPSTVVFIDGKELGREPLELTLRPGRTTVVLQNEDLALRRVEHLDLGPGETRTLMLTFGTGRLQLSAPARTLLHVDGKPAASGTLEVWEGLHRVDAVYANRWGTRITQVVDVPARATTWVHFKELSDVAGKRDSPAYPRVTR